MNPLHSAAVEELRAALLGEVITPADSPYDAARAVFNAMIDRRPAVIARCRGAADVIAAIAFAREQRLPIAVRGGGHSIAGHGTCDDGIVIDLSLMRGVHVDPERGTARVQAGATLADVDRETQVHGLAVPSGQVSETGIAGLTLNGGMGMLQRKYGLTCDNLLSAEMVTLDGEVVTASAEQNPELFWALRGGGGNFGVVTSFEYRAHPVGPMMLAGMVAYPVEQAVEVLRFLRDTISSTPDELSTDVVFLRVPALGFFPEEHRGRPVVGFFLRYSGPLDDGWDVIRPIREFGTPLIDVVEPMPLVTVQSMLDPANPRGHQQYWTSEFLPRFGSAEIETVARIGSDLPSPETVMQVIPFDAQPTRIEPDATAFSHREESWLIHIVGQWHDPAENDRCRAWVKESGAALRAFGSGASYLNLLSEEPGTDRVTGFWDDARLRRLARVKAQYDPENLLRFNHNIPPAPAEAGQ
ncbi:FAD-binding oxidoreductase [Streptomyces sp. NRRL S-920]|uniref:FAD-binding oxidoreductase n=1 Tax=Streptomyces sp. NRRL S-920 TaxID=1463921 RepID=UPI0004C7DB7C|nr:FAD-binding oxidoreductase [Streptomyces sp. NRRL S-920]